MENKMVKLYIAVLKEIMPALYATLEGDEKSSPELQRNTVLP